MAAIEVTEARTSRLVIGEASNTRWVDAFENRVVFFMFLLLLGFVAGNQSRLFVWREQCRGIFDLVSHSRNQGFKLKYAFPAEKRKIIFRKNLSAG